MTFNHKINSLNVYLYIDFKIKTNIRGMVYFNKIGITCDIGRFLLLLLRYYRCAIKMFILFLFLIPPQTLFFAEKSEKQKIKNSGLKLKPCQYITLEHNRKQNDNNPNK